MLADPRYRDRATQVEAARLAGVQQGTVSDWNKKDRGAELKNAILLAKKLNVCVEWLYTERAPMRPAPADDEELRQLLSVWGQLTPEQKRDLIGYARVMAKGAPFSEPSPKSVQPSRAAS